jgi:hypothetical protein
MHDPSDLAPSMDRTRQPLPAQSPLLIHCDDEAVLQSNSHTADTAGIPLELSALFDRGDIHSRFKAEYMSRLRLGLPQRPLNEIRVLMPFQPDAMAQTMREDAEVGTIGAGSLATEREHVVGDNFAGGDIQLG